MNEHEQNLKKIFNDLEKNFDQYFEELREFVKLGCIASSGMGVQENVEKISKLYEELGADTQILKIKDGYPIIYGKILSKNPNAKQVVHYNKYDGNSAYEDDWVVDPFGAEVIDSEKVPGLPAHLGKVLVNRAAVDSKSPHFCVMKGIKTMMNIVGDIPVNLHLICEGEHEIGSPHLGQLNDMPGIGEVLKTADCFIQFPGNRGGSEKMGMDMSKAQVRLGCKGGTFCELSVKGGEWGGPIGRDLEATGGFVDSPAWRLIWALNTLKDPSGKVAIDGFYDDFRSPNPEEMQNAKELRGEIFNEEEWKKLYEVNKFRRGLTGWDLFFDWIFAPDIEITGFKTGRMGPGLESAFPKAAYAKILIRLQPEQDPRDIAWKVRKHLNTHGFPEVDLNFTAFYRALRTSSKTELAKSLVNTTKRLGLTPVIWPSLWAGAPYSQIVNPGVPFAGGNAVSGGHHHQANEYVVVDTLLDGMKIFPLWAYEFAGLLPPLPK